MFCWWKCMCVICVSACEEELINLQSFQGNLSIRNTGVVHRQAALVVSRWGSWLSFPPIVMPCQSSWDKDPFPLFLAPVHIIPWIALTCSVRDPHQDLYLLYCQNWLFEIYLDQALDGDFRIKVLYGSLQASCIDCLLPLSELGHQPLPMNKQQSWDWKASWNLVRRHAGNLGHMFFLCTVVGKSCGSVKRRHWRSSLCCEKVGYRRGRGGNSVFRNTLWFELHYCPVTPLLGGILHAASNFDFF